MELLSSPSNLQPFCPSMSLTPSINTTSLASEGTPRCSQQRVSFDVVEEELQHPHGNVPDENAKCKQRQNQGLRGQRKQWLLSRQAIRRTSREFFCAKNCLRSLGFQKIQQARLQFFNLNRGPQNVFLRSCIRRSTFSTKYAVSVVVVCRASFLKVFGISNLRIQKIISNVSQESLSLSFSTHETPQYCFLKQWLGNFITFNGEVLPNSNFTHLPDNFTKREVYNLYVESQKDSLNSTLSLPSFLLIWHQDFHHVKIPKKSRMGVCQICAELKAKQDKARRSKDCTR